MNTDLEVKTPPKRTDTVREGQAIEAATAEAHERESRVEEATHREEVEQKVAPLPPEDEVVVEAMQRMASGAVK